MIKVFGGKQRADQISISQAHIYHSAPQAIEIGPGIQNIKISNVQVIGDGGTVGLKSNTPYVAVSKFHSEGYATPIQMTEMVSSTLFLNS